MLQNLLILSISPLNKDPRVLRQIKWLLNDYMITTVGTCPSNVGDVDHIDYEERASTPNKKIERMLKLLIRDYDAFYWRDERKEIVNKLRKKKFSVIIANDFDTLPLAFAVANENTRIIFDAHEYAPQHFEDQWQWRFMVQPVARYICNKFIPKVDSATTVCQSIAEKYEVNFGKKFDVITNAPEFANLSPSSVTGDRIRIIYHGVASKSRKTELQVEMMKYLSDRFELNLMLLGQESYLHKLQRMAAGINNIKFLPPVKTEEIASFTNQFDIGLFLLPPTNTNYEYALPNKFFEYIQARLAIAIGPSVEMKCIVEEYDLGVVAEDFCPKSMASAIQTLSREKIDYYKLQSHKHAYNLSAGKNREEFISIIKEL